MEQGESNALQTKEQTKREFQPIRSNGYENEAASAADLYDKNQDLRFLAKVNAGLTAMLLIPETSRSL